MPKHKASGNRIPVPQLASLFQEGLACHQRGQFAAAQAIYERILEAQPAHFDALQLLGTVFLQTGNLQRASEILQSALRVNPEHAPTCNNLGVALKGLQQPEAALEYLDRALRLEPAYVDAYFNRGLVQQDLGHLEAALEDLDAVLRLKPEHAGAHYSRGLILQHLGRLEAALDSYRNAIALQPNYPEAYNNLGNVLRELKAPEAALVAYEQAIRQDGTYAEAYYNCSVALPELQQLELALASCDRAIALRPGYPEAFSQRGNILLALGQLSAAQTAYDEAIRLKPDYAEAHWNRGLLDLLRGDFAHGWAEYEWRWKRPEEKFRPRGFSSPAWRGETSLAGKTILLYAEQGFGDTLQFCRYAEAVAALGARVVLEVPGALAGLLSGLSGVSQLVVAGGPLPAFDCHCPLLSLPLALQTGLQTIPAPPRLAIDPVRREAWQAKLGVRSRPRVGLVWSGAAYHANDRNRSLPLSQFAACLPDGLEYISLQREIREADREALAQKERGRIRLFCDELNDFTDTAALCELVDVVISVDTSVAHLSATLGRPTWILLPFIPDWRWLLDRDDSPWYPSARLFRQDCPGDWGGVLERVLGDLQKLVP